MQVTKFERGIPAATALAATAVAAASLIAVATPAAAVPAHGLSDGAAAAAASAVFQGDRSREVVAVQILLDRAEHSPGVVDGLMGANTRRAIRAYQRANGWPVTGEITPALLEHLQRRSAGALFQRYTIAREDVDGPFRSVPSGMAAKAELDRVAYESPAELLAEKFHMAQSFLKALNPGADFAAAGTTILVANPGGEKLTAPVGRIEVDKDANELRAFDEAGKLVATYPTTVGSNVHPSPNQTLQVVAVAMDPVYYFDPSGRSWGPDVELTIAPGPNNPVGTVWIDLSRDGYGIHGTPNPALIGKTSSHGCVRLTNWDATELARAVSDGTTVAFT